MSKSSLSLAQNLQTDTKVSREVTYTLPDQSNTLSLSNLTNKSFFPIPVLACVFHNNNYNIKTR